MSGTWALDLAVVDDAAEALLVQIDVLLDRTLWTHHVMTDPACPASPRFHEL